MNTTRFMKTTTTILAITLMAVFVQPSVNQSLNVFAENDSLESITQLQTQDNVTLEFNVPKTIIAGKLTPINAKAVDFDNSANLSHTDWSYAIISPNGELVHKTTTLHGHFGIMNFKDSFPEAGMYTIKYTVSSSGPFMLGMPIPELGQTRSVISGDLLKFDKDPKNNFGSRTFEFTVNVENQGKNLIIAGSEPNTEISVSFSTQPERIVVGQPVTFLFDVDDAKTGKDATHVDGQLTIRRGSYYPSTSADQPDAPIPIPLHGGYHGHLGAISTTHTFSQSGTYVIGAELSSIPYSVPMFGQNSARFVVQVFENEEVSDVIETQQMQQSKVPFVDIVGLESPFYIPNTIKVSPDETIVFSNSDGNQHTVTSVKKDTTEHDGKFDSGLLKFGENFELSLNEKGTYNYYCALHTNMRGTIIVS